MTKPELSAAEMTSADLIRKALICERNHWRWSTLGRPCSRCGAWWDEINRRLPRPT